MNTQNDKSVMIREILLPYLAEKTLCKVVTVSTAFRCFLPEYSDSITSAKYQERTDALIGATH